MDEDIRSKLAGNGYKFDKKFTCNKRDCKYLSSGRHGAWYNNGKCDYMRQTGHSRIAQLPEGEARWPINCPFYEKSEKRRRRRNETD